MLNTTAKKCLNKKIKNRISTKKSRKHKKWFDKDCFSQRRELKSVLNALNRYPYDINLCQKYYSKRKKIQSISKEKEKDF